MRARRLGPTRRRYNMPVVAARIVNAAEGMLEAVVRLRAGELVAFPTETVYGLGANALNPDAVARIFEAKGRPATNPLIVHVADVAAARALAGDWPAEAGALAARFWPGPLTLVVPKAEAVPDIVTAGGPTVGLRVPAHPVALELLRAADLPIAAPSANRSEEVSPTTAAHVAASLGPFVNDLLILDGGPSDVGIESTVLDVTGETPRILRPGMVTAARLAQIVGPLARGGNSGQAGPARAPGQQTRHYAPRAKVVVLSPEEIFGFPRWRPGDPPLLIPAGARSVLGPTDGYIWRTLWPAAGNTPNVCLSGSSEDYAARLYAALRRMDETGVERIVVEEPPRGPKWAAIHDRLRRAAAPKVETSSR